jgi:hypothetical protein
MSKLPNKTAFVATKGQSFQMGEIIDLFDQMTTATSTMELQSGMLLYALGPAMNAVTKIPVIRSCRLLFMYVLHNNKFLLTVHASNLV